MKITGDRTATPRARGIIVYLVLLAAGFAVYSEALGHPFMQNWDDEWYVTQNETVRGLTADHLKRAFTEVCVANYAPVHLISYMIDFELTPARDRSPLSPFMFHLTNYLLHVTAAWLVYRLARAYNLADGAAALAAAVFLVHPLQVETVAWVAERKNILFVLFSLGAWLAYLRSRETGRNGWVAASLGFFVLALFSKSHAVVLAAVLPAHEYFFPRPGESRLNVLRRLTPYIVLAVVAGCISIGLQWKGAEETYYENAPLRIALTSPVIFSKYLALTAYPTHLSALYDVPAVMTLTDTRGWIGMAVTAGFGVLLIYLAVRRHQLGFWMWVYLAALAPVLQIVPMTTPMNDRYLYFSMIGAGVVAGLALWPKPGTAGFGRVIRSAAAIVLVIALAGLSRKQVDVWESPLTLWSHAAGEFPASGRVQEKYGEAFFMLGKYADAIERLDRASAMRYDRAGTLLYRGRAFRAIGQFDDARENFRRLGEEKRYQELARQELARTPN